MWDEDSSSLSESWQVGKLTAASYLPYAALFRNSSLATFHIVKYTKLSSNHIPRELFRNHGWKHHHP